MIQIDVSKDSETFIMNENGRLMKNLSPSCF